jgi:hypothetical protein
MTQKSLRPFSFLKKSPVLFNYLSMISDVKMNLAKIKERKGMGIVPSKQENFPLKH